MRTAGRALLALFLGTAVFFTCHLLERELFEGHGGKPSLLLRWGIDISVHAFYETISLVCLAGGALALFSRIGKILTILGTFFAERVFPGLLFIAFIWIIGYGLHATFKGADGGTTDERPHKMSPLEWMLMNKLGSH